MARAFQTIFAAIILVRSFAAPVAAGPLDDIDAAIKARDYSTAAQLLRPLAEQGNADAQVKLAALYSEGEGVPQDNVEAAKWVGKAADQGFVSAQYILGALHGAGQGVPQDCVLQHMWLSLAAAQGDQTAEAFRDEVARLMTSAQIAEAQKLAREWKPER
jgi:TPR repeat protein